MDSRVVLEAFIPSTEEFAREACRPTSNPHVTLRQSLKEHFPPTITEPLPSPQALKERLIRVNSLPELQRAIMHARSHKLKVKASTGGLSSISNRKLLNGGGMVIDVSALNKMAYHDTRGVITCQTAVSIRDLNCGADAWGVSQKVHIAASACMKSVGAAFVLGAYGYGGNEGILGDAVVEISLVDCRGRLRVYSNRNRVWKGVKMSLGMWGVIYDITIRVDTFRRMAHVRDEFISLGVMLRPGVLERLVLRKGGAQMMWTPFNSYRGKGSEWKGREDVVWVRSMKRGVVQGVDEDEDVMFRMLTVVQWVSLKGEELVKQGYGKFEEEDVKLFHALGLQQSAWKFCGGGGLLISHAVGFQCDAENFPVVEVGCGFNGWGNVRKGWEIVVSEVESWERQGKYPLNVCVRMNVVKESDAYLSSGGIAMLTVVSAKHTKGWEAFAERLVRKWVGVGGRVQLSREMGNVWHGGVDGGKEWKRAWREEGVDDCGMFSHGVFAELLGMHDDADRAAAGDSGVGGGNLSWAKSVDGLLSSRDWGDTLDEAPVVRRRLSYHERIAAASDEEGAQKEQLAQVRAKVARRRKVAPRFDPVLSPPEWWALLGYVMCYVVLWLGLFGRPAAQQLGWIA